MPMFSAIKKGLNSNLHFIGVVLFFILHGYARNYPLIPIGPLMLLLLELLAVGFALYWISAKLLGSQSKAGIFTSFALVINLFFLPFQNFFASYHFSATFARLIYFLPACIVSIIVVGIWLKKSHRKFSRATAFINTLLAIYVLVECFIIMGNIFFPSSHKNNGLSRYKLAKCDTCKKISVYLIISDEHLGFEAQRKYLNYYDTSFQSFLCSEGFYLVQHPRSNYVLTIFSIASLLNMRYHENEMRPLLTSNHFAYNRAQEAIRDNTVCDFFEKEGYRIINNSIFGLKNAPEGYTNELPSSIRLITNQTLFYQVFKNFPQALNEHIHISWLSHALEDKVVNDNELMMVRTLAEAEKHNQQPTFTYVHLLMPHVPFAYDSSGHRIYDVPYRKKPYFQYLVYCEKRLARFVSELKQATKGEAAIILMGDHGSRILLTPKTKEYAFQPLTAIYLPDKDYQGWYPGISHVNQFRVLFNNLFHQSLPMLPDSICY